VSPERRTAVFATGSLAALTALALTGCAPVGTGGDGTGAPANKPAAVAKENPAAQAEPTKSPGPKKANVKLTTELVAKKTPRMGNVVTDQAGFTLYRFDEDVAKPTPKTNCAGNCAKVWPPAITDGNTTLSGIDEELIGSVTRPDGTRQLTIDGWAVYRYIGDKKAGQWTGQGVGNKWFVIAPDGKRNKSCLPAKPPKAAKPPAEDTGGGGEGGAGEEEPGYGY
jgi:predicted lipoprotein with Yx(FWY)xxD motif